MALKLSNILPGIKGQILDLDASTTINGSAIGVLGFITSSSVNALGAGLNGTTNPAFNVDASTGSQAAGLNVIGATASGTVAVAVISSGGAANLTLNALGTGTIGIGTVSTGAITLGAATTISGNLTLSTKNIVTDASTGTKIGTATTQKLGFYNATPVAQQSTTGTSTGFTAGAGTTATSLSTFTGNSGSTAYTVADVVLALKNLGFLAA